MNEFCLYHVRFYQIELVSTNIRHTKFIQSKSNYSIIMDAVPKPKSATFRDKGLGLPIYLLVGFLALLLIVASNTVLTTQPPYLCGSKPSSHLPYGFSSPSKYLPLPLFLCLPTQKAPPCHSSSLLFYSLPLVRVQIITFSSVSTQSHFCLESQGKMSPSKDSLETCSRR